MTTSPQPRPGYFSLRMATGAAVVGAVIYKPCPIEMIEDIFNPLDRVMPLLAQVNGKECEPWKIWAAHLLTDMKDRSQFAPDDFLAHKTFWFDCYEINQHQYRFLIDDRAWAKAYAPDSPEAQPYKKVHTSKPKSAPVQKVDIRTVPAASLF